MLAGFEEGREPGNFKNIQALIEGYTSGTLTIDTDDRSVVCYFFNGKQKTGWLGMHDEDFDLDAMWEQWREEESGVGRVWMEMVGIGQLPVLFGLPDVDLLKYWMMQPFAFHQMAARAAFPPTNQHQHHEVCNCPDRPDSRFSS